MREAREYRTGRRLGRATDKLAQASDEAPHGAGGVVLAYQTTDPSGEVWDYLPDAQGADLRRTGYAVAAVFVLP